MVSPDAYTQGGGSVAGSDSWPSASTEADLDTLIGLSVNCETPVAIVDDGKMVGLVTKDILLRSVQGEN